MHLLTAIPVYNEEEYLKPVLAEVLRYAGDVLVVDDGFDRPDARTASGLPHGPDRSVIPATWATGPACARRSGRPSNRVTTVW